MKNFDFIEIGTCYFQTIIEQCNDSHVGISVEPIKEYLDRLPNKTNVVKLNAAVVAPHDIDENGEWDLYYVDDETIRKHDLGTWLAGCNSVGKPHDFHINYYPNPDIWHNTKDKTTLPTRNLVTLGYVKCVKVKCLTFEQLVQQFDVGKIDILKIDTEGYDCVLLNSVLDYYESKKKDSPNRILFETNSHTPEDEVLSVKKRLLEFDYNLKSSYHDTYAEKFR